MSRTEKPDDLSSIADLIRFFSCAGQFSFYDGNIPKDVHCQFALHLVISLPFTDTSMKMDALSVIGLFEKWRLRTKWSKTVDCP